MVVVATLVQPFTDPKWLYFDPLVAAEMAPECCRVYFGAMSMLGVMLWVATAAICLFTALMLMLTGLSPVLRRFALAAGCLTGWMALDDAFLIHENILPAFGVPQNVVLASYGLLGLGYLAIARAHMRSVDGVLLVAACAGFAVSLGVDVIVHSPATYAMVAEDGAKFFGIWYWMVFHAAALTRGLLLDHGADAPDWVKDDLAAFEAEGAEDVSYAEPGRRVA